jgi:hypothetical protein
VQEAVHWLVTVSQTRPASPHWPLPTHWTHRFVDVLQWTRVALPAQSGSLVHCTHSPVDVLHAGAPPPHCALVVQPWTH